MTRAYGGRRIADVVSWPVGRVGLWRRLTALSELAWDVDSGLDGVWMPGDWWGLARLRVPRRPGARMAVPPAVLTTLEEDDSWDVLTFADRLELVPGRSLREQLGGAPAGPSVPGAVLAQWRVVDARRGGPLPGRRRSRDPLAHWSLELQGPPGQPSLRLQGRWVTLAWIGHLCGWPDPVSR